MGNKDEHQYGPSGYNVHIRRGREQAQKAGQAGNAEINMVPAINGAKAEKYAPMLLFTMFCTFSTIHSATIWRLEWGAHGNAMGQVQAQPQNGEDHHQGIDLRFRDGPDPSPAWEW